MLFGEVFHLSGTITIFPLLGFEFSTTTNIFGCLGFILMGDRDRNSKKMTLLVQLMCHFFEILALFLRMSEKTVPFEHTLGLAIMNSNCYNVSFCHNRWSSSVLRMKLSNTASELL